MARYMQIISPEFIREYPHRIINIHHSFLPAFVGAGLYLEIVRLSDRTYTSLSLFSQTRTDRHTSGELRLSVHLPTMQRSIWMKVPSSTKVLQLFRTMIRKKRLLARGRKSSGPFSRGRFMGTRRIAFLCMVTRPWFSNLNHTRVVWRRLNAE